MRLSSSPYKLSSQYVLLGLATQRWVNLWDNNHEDCPYYRRRTDRHSFGDAPTDDALGETPGEQSSGVFSDIGNPMILILIIYRHNS
jgi:hypothetical protein